MDPAAQNTLLAVAVVIAALCVVQTIALFVLVLGFRKMGSRIDSLTASVEEAVRSAQPLLQATRELVVDSREKIGLVSQNLLEITELMKNQATRIDDAIEDASQRLRIQVIRIDQLVSSTVTKVEQTTETIQRNVLAPVREISAILVGVRTAVEFLRRRGKVRTERATQEEELFI